MPHSSYFEVDRVSTLCKVPDGKCDVHRGGLSGVSLQVSQNILFKNCMTRKIVELWRGELKTNKCSATHLEHMHFKHLQVLNWQGVNVESEGNGWHLAVANSP